MPVGLKWAFDAHGACSTEGPPAQGTHQVADAHGTRQHQVLANTLDSTRAEINRITTHWKDVVGLEQDSAMGRSNQAHNDRGGQEREENDEDDKDVETEEE